MVEQQKSYLVLEKNAITFYIGSKKTKSCNTNQRKNCMTIKSQNLRIGTDSTNTDNQPSAPQRRRKRNTCLNSFLTAKSQKMLRLRHLDWFPEGNNFFLLFPVSNGRKREISQTKKEFGEIKKGNLFERKNEKKS